jgi:hypothetical protein
VPSEILSQIKQGTSMSAAFRIEALGFGTPRNLRRTTRQVARVHYLGSIHFPTCKMLPSFWNPPTFLDNQGQQQAPGFENPFSNACIVQPPSFRSQSDKAPSCVPLEGRKCEMKQGLGPLMGQSQTRPCRRAHPSLRRRRLASITTQRPKRKCRDAKPRKIGIHFWSLVDKFKLASVVANCR